MKIEDIKSPEDIKDLSPIELKSLASDIRKFLISSIAKTGGHLAANLGAVELTLALHYAFDSPNDKFVFDVGHQSYTHKILTGRKEILEKVWANGGICGFPRLGESQHDAFGTGHSSTSISAAFAIASAMQKKGNKENRAIAVIGDGAITGGEAFEGLNNAGQSKANLIVVLNDNEMSICKNVGAMAKYLNRFRSQPAYTTFKANLDQTLNRIPKIGKGLSDTAVRVKSSIRNLVLPLTIFEQMGFKYAGPVDGHNIAELITALERAKKLEGPVLLHVITKKGKGYNFAENKPDVFHSIGAFSAHTGETVKKTDEIHANADQAFGEKLCELSVKNEEIIAVNAAMTKGTGLLKFRKLFADRFFDVGIAEQHAVTFAAGLAKEGFRPVVAIYSTFMQRAYDQILHDVALQNLPVVLMLPSSGINRAGDTHHGIYDIAFLQTIPNLEVLAPSSCEMLEEMLEYATKQPNAVAIRYPQKMLKKNPEIKNKGTSTAIISVGDMLGICQNAANKKFDVIDLQKIYPLDKEFLLDATANANRIITVEHGIVQGGVGEKISLLLRDKEVINLGVNKDEFIGWKTLEEIGLGEETIRRVLNGE